MHIAKTSGVVVAVAAALVLLPNLGGPPLWDDDEPRNAACSLAMYAGGDWIVPTFNGRLRVEKPVLVNWLHLAGFSVCGTNEWGARLPSALLTLATCLLVWRIGSDLFGAAAGRWGGVAMGTCLWTGIGGRACTPDAPLVFCATLALWLFVRGTGRRDGPVGLSQAAAIAVGAACGLAILAKGPVGLVLPLAAFLLFASWQGAVDPGRTGPRPLRLLAAFRAGWRGIHATTICLAACIVAAPWYAAVTLRTDGQWLREFLLVHNAGRFAAPMEGHSGSMVLYYPLVLLVGMFPWSSAAALIGHHAHRGLGADDGGIRSGSRLLLAWLAAWVIPFSLAATKLPGYVWPAYPAIAVLTGWFIAAWIARPSATIDAWMRAAWCFLAAAGLAIGVVLPFVARRHAPGLEWLGIVGVVPVAGAMLAWACQSLRSRIAASATLATTACLTVGLIVSLAPEALGRRGGPRSLLQLAAANAECRPVTIGAYRTPPSIAFYGGQLATDGRVAELLTPADVATFLAANPGAPLVVDARFQTQLSPILTPAYRVSGVTTSLPESRRLLLLEPDRGPPTGPLAAVDSPLRR
jgi:4-amino-4-deoxy-L-arabinose transferase-like glycosyltransferase